jgi:hypothetical protein
MPWFFNICCFLKCSYILVVGTEMQKFYFKEVHNYNIILSLSVLKENLSS